MNTNIIKNDDLNTNSNNSLAGADIGGLQAFLIAAAEELHRHLADRCKSTPPTLDELERHFRLLHKCQALDLKREQLAIARLRAETQAIKCPTNRATSALGPNTPFVERTAVSPTTHAPTPPRSKPPIPAPMTQKDHASFAAWVAELTGSRPASLNQSEHYTPSWIEHRPPFGKLTVFPVQTRTLAAA